MVYSFDIKKSKNTLDTYKLTNGYAKIVSYLDEQLKINSVSKLAKQGNINYQILYEYSKTHDNKLRMAPSWSTFNRLFNSYSEYVFSKTDQEYYSELLRSISIEILNVFSLPLNANGLADLLDVSVTQAKRYYNSLKKLNTSPRILAESVIYVYSKLTSKKEQVKEYIELKIDDLAPLLDEKTQTLTKIKAVLNDEAFVQRKLSSRMVKQLNAIVLLNQPIERDQLSQNIVKILDGYKTT